MPPADRERAPAAGQRAGLTPHTPALHTPPRTVAHTTRRPLRSSPALPSAEAPWVWRPPTPQKPLTARWEPVPGVKTQEAAVARPVAAAPSPVRSSLDSLDGRRP